MSINKLIVLGILITILFAKNLETIQDPFTRTEANNKAQTKPFVVNVRNQSPKVICQAIAPYYADILFKPCNESNQILFATDKKKYLDILKVIRSIDYKQQQVAIEVTVIELTEDGIKELGLLTNITTTGLQIAKNSNSSLQAIVTALEGKGTARILASPRIKALRGEQATIQIGDKLPYTIPVESENGIIWSVKYIDAGINLKISPTKIFRNEIELALAPEVASIKQWKVTAAGEYPVISTRKVQTVLRVTNGEMFIIGGLLNEEERKSRTTIPLLGNIPLVGNLFSKIKEEKVKSDIAFLVKATIL